MTFILIIALICYFWWRISKGLNKFNKFLNGLGNKVGSLSPVPFHNNAEQLKGTIENFHDEYLNNVRKEIEEITS